MDWLDLLAVQRTLKSLLQHHSSKASILRHSAFFIVQLSHPYVTTGKTIALTRQTFVDKVMSLLFSMLSRLVITFLPRGKRLLISWLQSLSAVILEPPQNKVSHCFHCASTAPPVCPQFPSFLSRSIYRDGPALIPPAVLRDRRYVFLVLSTDEDELYLNAPGGLFTPRSDSEGEIVDFRLM